MHGFVVGLSAAMHAELDIWQHARDMLMELRHITCRYVPVLLFCLLELIVLARGLSACMSTCVLVLVGTKTTLHHNSITDNTCLCTPRSPGGSWSRSRGAHTRHCHTLQTAAREGGKREGLCQGFKMLNPVCTTQPFPNPLQSRSRGCRVLCVKSSQGSTQTRQIQSPLLLPCPPGCWPIM
jgi:hypothetical protein